MQVVLAYQPQLGLAAPSLSDMAVKWNIMQHEWVMASILVVGIKLIALSGWA